MAAAILMLSAMSGLSAQPAQPDDPNSGVPAGAYQRSEAIMWTTLGLGAAHHIDHVLRANHSGFPFTSRVTTFTGTLAIYPLVAGGYALDAGPNYWILFDSLAFAGLGIAHTLIEPPADQYTPWVNGTNLLGTRSPALGRAAQAVSVSLQLALSAHLISNIIDGVQHGFTWRRR